MPRGRLFCARSSAIDSARPPLSASGLCASHSYFDSQKRALIRIAISFSRAGSELLNLRYSPSFCTRSASSGLRSSGPKGPRTPPRGPPAMASSTRFWASVSLSRGMSGKRACAIAVVENARVKRAASILTDLARNPFPRGVGLAGGKMLDRGRHEVRRQLLRDRAELGIGDHGDPPHLPMVITHKAQVRRHRPEAVPAGERGELDDDARQRAFLLDVRVHGFRDLRKVFPGQL